MLDLLELELQVLMSCLMYVLGIKLRSHLFSPFMFVLIQSCVSPAVLELVMYPVFYKCMPPYQVCNTTIWHVESVLKESQTWRR